MKTVTYCRPVNTGITSWNDLGNMMDSIFGENFFSPADKIFDPVIHSRSPRMDVRDTEKSFIAEAELPGFDEKEIEINLEDNVLTISAKKAESSEETAKDKKDDSFLIRERRNRSFSRSLRLPDNADPEAVKAVFKNGILSLEIAKKAEAAKKLIPISAE